MLPIVGFAGMSHLGINTAVATAERGFNAICFDTDISLIKKLQKKKLPLVEPDLLPLFIKNTLANRLQFSENVNSLYDCDIVYISSDVTTDVEGKSDLATVKSLIELVCNNINPKAILIINYESAELAKISINCCLVANISVANMLSEICEKIGANWSEIIPALRLDKRIGPYSYITPGLGIAGGNLERDLTTVLNLAEEHGTDNNIVKSWLGNSRYRKDWVLKILHQSILARIPNPSIAVLGLTYKENTNSTKNSPALALLESLKTYNIQSYDPTIKVPIVPWVKCVL